MDGSPSSVLTMGLGTWGSVNLTTTLGYGIGEAVVDPTTLHGWLEAAVGGRLHASVQGQLQAAVKGRLHANADEGD